MTTKMASGDDNYDHGNGAAGDEVDNDGNDDNDGDGR
jgi:hypothetical protein